MSKEDNELIYMRYNSIYQWDLNNERDVLEHDIIMSILRANGSIIGEAKVRYLPKCGTINIYPDHGFPHCHISVTDELDIKVRLDNFEILGDNGMSSKQRKAFNKFLEQGGKQMLTDFWNKRNPNNMISY